MMRNLAPGDLVKKACNLCNQDWPGCSIMNMMHWKVIVFLGGPYRFTAFVHVRCHFQPLPTKLVFAYFDRGSHEHAAILNTLRHEEHWQVGQSSLKRTFGEIAALFKQVTQPLGLSRPVSSSAPGGHWTFTTWASFQKSSVTFMIWCWKQRASNDTLGLAHRISKVLPTAHPCKELVPISLVLIKKLNATPTLWLRITMAFNRFYSSRSQPNNPKP